MTLEQARRLRALEQRMDAWANTANRDREAMVTALDAFQRHLDRFTQTLDQLASRVGVLEDAR